MLLRMAVPLVICAALAASLPASASHLVTGNGFGFAVVAPETGTVTKFYAHPYSFLRPDPKNALSEGVETTNFIKSLSFGEAAAGPTSADYVEDSHVIRIKSGAGEALVFMPFGSKRAALVVVAADGATPHVEWSHSVKRTRRTALPSATVRIVSFDRLPETLLMIPLAPEHDAAVTPDQLEGSSAWVLVALENEGELDAAVRDVVAWRAGLAAAELARREISELEQWRVKPTVTFSSEQERHLWRQSEAMLRIAQCREPNRAGFNGNGLIVASLPDGVWFTPWVRDMSYAAVALARMGHRAEARAAVLAYFNARPTGKMKAETAGADYQISVVRYFGNGEEEPFFTEEGSTNIEFDDWGLALWALGAYLRKYDDPALLKETTARGPLYASARDYVVKPLIRNTQDYGGGAIVMADTSIWEERQKDQKHFAWSTALAIVGLGEFADVARRAGDEGTRTAMLKEVSQLLKGFNAAFVRGGRLHGTLEEGVKNDIDGALLAVIDFGVVKDDAVVRDAVERMELLKVASGGYRRVRSTYTDPAIFEYWYERQEFLFVDFSLAEVDWRLGRDLEAEAILKRIVEKSAADHDIIPEMYVAVPCKLFPGAIGDPTGAIPMVGYGAGEYILHLLKREARATR
jgi:GH15 family glucan-1,4-alpha-glucosidase